MVYSSITKVNMSLLKKRWVQDVIVYGVIALLAVFIIYGVVNGIQSASAPITDEKEDTLSL